MSSFARTGGDGRAPSFACERSGGNDRTSSYGRERGDRESRPPIFGRETNDRPFASGRDRTAARSRDTGSSQARDDFGDDRSYKPSNSYRSESSSSFTRPARDSSGDLPAKTSFGRTPATPHDPHRASPHPGNETWTAIHRLFALLPQIREAEAASRSNSPVEPLIDEAREALHEIHTVLNANHKHRSDDEQEDIARRRNFIDKKLVRQSAILGRREAGNKAKVTGLVRASKDRWVLVARGEIVPTANFTDEPAPPPRREPSRNNTPAPTDLDTWAPLHRLIELLPQIQDAEAANRSNTPVEPLIREARLALREVNTVLSTEDSRQTPAELQEMRERRMFLERKLHHHSAALGKGEGGSIAHSTALIRAARDRWELVVRGNTVPEIRFSAARTEFAVDMSARRRDDAPEPTTSNPRTRESDTRSANFPQPVPHTVADSTFLYGYNAVLAALRANRRPLHHLYLSSRFPPDSPLLTLATRLKLRTTLHASVQLLDRLSANRPHNGVVLDASPLPSIPVRHLERVSSPTASISLALTPAARGTALLSGGVTSSIPSTAMRFPLVLFLDGILDEGNLGSILRTAHFYGVDAVAVATRTCAPLDSAIVAKSSSGACEAVPILAVGEAANFVYGCRSEGWEIYAAAALGSEGAEGGRSSGRVVRRTTTARVAQEGVLSKGPPVLLILGAEGEGLRESLMAKAQWKIGIEGAQHEQGGDGDVGVESLNVGVAAGVLVESFLRGVGKAGVEEAPEKGVQEVRASDGDDTVDMSDLGF